ncbi:transcriptional repressor [Candidatus Parcubacteria bacterium]|nr:transcriptional repressor [Candidatus Parcubacteria bacterium]
MDVEIKQFKKLLRKNEHYVTKARLRLFIALQKTPALSIKDLVKRLPKHDRSTIYRNITAFEKLGIIARLQMGWNSKVELSDMFQHHHHHFTCHRCGQVMNLPENSALENEIAKLASSQNCKQTDHQLEIRGWCKNCLAD